MTEKEERLRKENIRKKFGKHIRKLRQDRKISAVELASSSNMEKSHFSRLENGGTMPTLYTLIKISEALEIPFDQLLKEFKI
ncbi:MAG: helix-turn-helix transcriptional regulator [Bacteroidetes bacterium]|nr:helix-turn-helix transcriptional regulator [Bacteroidota bacterium]